MSLTDHYDQDGVLEQRLLARLADAGYDIDTLSVRDLAGADEFHLGGRAATESILAGLDIGPSHRVLDIGCGLGGPARHLAEATGCEVHGVDLTAEFVDVAIALSARTGLGDLTRFECRDVDADGLPEGEFDLVTIFHVGMNIADKPTLFGLIADRIRSDGAVVVYDIMRIGDGDLEWPMPWSAGPSTSFVESPDAYREALAGAGLRVEDERDLRPLVKAALEAADADPPAVTLRDLMGDGFPTMIGNLRAALGGGVLAPTLMVARR